MVTLLHDDNLFWEFKMCRWKPIYVSVYLFLTSSCVWADTEDKSDESLECDGVVTDTSGQLQQKFKNMTAGQMNDPTVVTPEEGGCFMEYVFGKVVDKLYIQEDNPDVAVPCVLRFFTEPQPHKTSNDRTVMKKGEDLLIDLTHKPELQDDKATKVFGYITYKLYKMARSPKYCPELYDKTK